MSFQTRAEARASGLVAAEERLREERFAHASAVLFVIGDPLGRDPGRFTMRLIQAMIVADTANLAKLATAFPGLALTVAEAKYGDVDELRSLMVGAL